MAQTKNDRTMRLAWILLAFALISAVLVSGTMAKYVTTASGTDTARVAAWGVNVAGDVALFDTNYAADDSTYTLTADSVISTAGNVVAPGTSGTAAAFTITGTPEVATRVTFAAGAGSALAGWGGYEPIVWSVTINGATTSDLTFDQMLAALDGVSLDFAPNTNLSAAATDVAVAWDWPFSTGAANDILDTNLGNAATPATITLNLAATVTQID